MVLTLPVKLKKLIDLPKFFFKNSLRTPKDYQDEIILKPMYLIHFDIDKQYLYQRGSFLMDQDGNFWSGTNIMDSFGLNLLGLKIDDLIDIYYESMYDI